MTTHFTPKILCIVFILFSVIFAAILMLLSMRSSNDLLGSVLSPFFIQADFGDAPAPYPALSDQNGPKAGNNNNLVWMGKGYTLESDARNNDDYDDGCEFLGAFRQDGTFSYSPPYISGSVGGIMARVAGSQFPAYLNVFIDWSKNGAWDKSDEWVVRDFKVEERGLVIPHNFSVPASPEKGNAWARCIISGTPINALSSNGGERMKFQYGEIEDYMIAL